MMPYKMLDAIVLVIDVPEHGLRAGDVGAVVAVYGDSAVEVEFVTGAGNTQALPSSPLTHVRSHLWTFLPCGHSCRADIPAVRILGSATAA